MPPILSLKNVSLSIQSQRILHDVSLSVQPGEVVGLIGPLRLILFGVILLAAVWIRRKDMFPVARHI